MPCVTVMPVLPRIDLNCNSLPLACANIWLPDPKFTALAPAVLVSKLFQLVVSPKYASILWLSELYLISPTSVCGLCAVVPTGIFIAAVPGILVFSANSILMSPPIPSALVTLICPAVCSTFLALLTPALLTTRPLPCSVFKLFKNSCSVLVACW